VTLIKEFFFCPRIPYIVLSTNYPQMPFEYVEIAKELEDEVIREALEIIGGEIVARKIEVSSHRLGLYGIIDCIVKVGGMLYVLEVKDVPHENLMISHKFQTLAYVLLAKETGINVRGGMIYYKRARKIFHIKPSKDSVKTLLRIIEYIHKSIKLGMPTIYGKKCATCSYRHLCDR